MKVQFFVFETFFVFFKKNARYQMFSVTQCCRV